MNAPESLVQSDLPVLDPCASPPAAPSLPPRAPPAVVASQSDIGSPVPRTELRRWCPANPGCQKSAGEETPEQKGFQGKRSRRDPLRSTQAQETRTGPQECRRGKGSRPPRETEWVSLPSGSRETDGDGRSSSARRPVTGKRKGKTRERKVDKPKKGVP